jgi:DNA-binding NarL/FixJ family response regulator
MIRLIIADDDVKVRSAMNLLLDQDRACWQVVSEVRDLDELYIAVEKNRPQLLLLDWELPNACSPKYPSENGMSSQRVKRLRKINPLMYIMALSSKPQSKGEAFFCGVDAFVAKTDPPEVFLEALYAVCEYEARFAVDQA